MTLTADLGAGASALGNTLDRRPLLTMVDDALARLAAMVAGMPITEWR